MIYCYCNCRHIKLADKISPYQAKDQFKLLGAKNFFLFSSHFEMFNPYIDEL